MNEFSARDVWQPAVAQRLSRIGWITRVNDSVVPCGNPATNSLSWRGEGSELGRVRPSRGKPAFDQPDQGVRRVEAPSDLELMFRLLIESLMLAPLGEPGMVVGLIEAHLGCLQPVGLLQ